jgi:hypothetical protein
MEIFIEIWQKEAIRRRRCCCVLLDIKNKLSRS